MRAPAFAAILFVLLAVIAVPAEALGEARVRADDAASGETNELLREGPPQDIRARGCAAPAGASVTAPPPRRPAVPRRTSRSPRAPDMARLNGAGAHLLR